jgi:hypothetical protein
MGSKRICYNCYHLEYFGHCSIHKFKITDVMFKKCKNWKGIK